MSKITRVTQKIFGSSAGVNQIGVFGSLAAGSIAYTTSAATVQSLANYLTGWFGAIIGSNSPAIEDMNALFFLVTYQLAYLFQAGVAEYDSGTTYYTGSIVNSSGVLYTSLVDNNIGNALTNAAYWTLTASPNILVVTQNQNWTAPAGVTSVQITAVKNPPQSSASQGQTAGNAIGLTQAGQLYAWGDNSYGALGTNDIVFRSSPVLVVGGLTFQNALITSEESAYGVTPAGQGYAWGANGNNQLGTGLNGGATSSPALILGGLAIRNIYAGFNGATFALTQSGQLYAWGNNNSSFGSLGIGFVNPPYLVSSPVAVLGGLNFASVSVANGGPNDSAFALTTSGQLYGWGYNGPNGLLGTGDLLARSSPVAVVGGLTFQSIPYTFNSYMMGLTTSGQIYAWGANTGGTLGVGDNNNRSSPTLVVGGLTFAKIFPGFNGNTFALTTSGALYAWGTNNSGNLGVGDNNSRSSPTLVLGGLSFASVFTNDNLAVYGITTTGQMYAWGGNSNGQLGVGDNLPRSSPVAVLGGLTFAYGFSASAFYGGTYGVTTTGQMYAWGLNNGGQLGTGDVVPRSSPTLVLGSNLFAVLPTTTTQVIPVVPGTVYPIALKQFNATFGNSVVGSNSPDSLILEFF